MQRLWGDENDLKQVSLSSIASIDSMSQIDDQYIFFGTIITTHYFDHIQGLRTLCLLVLIIRD